MANNRRDAIFAREPTYNTGKACRYGHFSDRWTKSGVCVECGRLASALHGKSKASKTPRKIKGINHLINDLIENGCIKIDGFGNFVVNKASEGKSR